MNPLNLRSRQISLELHGVELQCETQRQEGARSDHEESNDDLRASRGILIALGLSALMWLIVLATVTFF